VGNSGRCRVSHEQTKGSGHCESFFPLR
jgi:hypothetical protein